MVHFIFERLTIYETNLRFYLVGTNAAGSTFKVLKIERSDPKNLIINEDNYDYSKADLDDLLSMIASLAVSKKNLGSKSNNNALNAIKCFGLVGFVRFLEGFYMLIVTKASRVCKVGYHLLYKIEETSMIYIPEEQPKFNPDEQRYVRTFQAVDLSTNFYFSYTYDLTRTLADNFRSENVGKNGPGEQLLDGGLKRKFLWNVFLGKACYESPGVSKSWILPVIHGFLASCHLHTSNVILTLVLLARRSSKFAGTRFLKRGASFEGDVANEVETEQIVYDPSLLSFERGRFTSFVQCRGSVPLIWWQDLTKVVGKPPIEIDLKDVFATVPALHFRDMLDSYGYPIIVVNLLKRRDKHSKEDALSEEYMRAISYLNQFLEPNRSILYCNFDMARCLKCDGNVLANLEEVGYNALKLTGFFQSFGPLYCHKIRPPTNYNAGSFNNEEMTFNEMTFRDCEGNSRIFGRQVGVARVNCVDCLDRTNVAQLVIGKVALAYQLHALAVLDEPYLHWESEICRSFEILFEEQGDTLALQYAGSQLVHSVRTYKKTSVLQERSRDVIQTLSRYYSNNFADYDKQNSLNLFLGVYVPGLSSKAPLWELQNDFWLQNRPEFCIPDDFDARKTSQDYCAWFLTDEKFFQRKYIKYVDQEDDPTCDNLKLSLYDLYYKTYKLTSFDLMLERAINHKLSNLSLGQAKTSVQSNGSGGQVLGKLFGKKIKMATDSTKLSNLNDEDSDSSEEGEGIERLDLSVAYCSYWPQTSQLTNCSSADLPLHSGRKHTAHRRKSHFATTSSNSCGPCYTSRRSHTPRTDSATFEALMPQTHKIYGFKLKCPSSNKRDWSKYQRFAALDRKNFSQQRFGRGYSKNSSPESANLVSLLAADSKFGTLPTDNVPRPPVEGRLRHLLIDRRDPSSLLPPAFDPLSLYTSDSSFGLDPPEVSLSSLRVYQRVVRRAERGADPPLDADLLKYVRHVIIK